LFTGIIEEIGKITSISGGSRFKELVVHARRIAQEAKLGQSISVNGVCLTITKTFSSDFQVQMGTETLKITNLSKLKAGDKVHLERGLKIGERLDGHLVQGHVDGTCELVRKSKSGENIELTIKYPQEIGTLLIPKGSVALNGVSLTLHSINRKSNHFVVSLIPHTIKSTLFSEYKEGTTLNIEVDLVGKYIHNIISEMLKNNSKRNIDSLSKEFLAKQGYL